MAENTAISWADRSWSPWFGCTQVSMGDQGACVGCYARQMSEFRFHRVVFGGPGRGEGTRDVAAESAWKEPLRWNRDVEKATVAWLHGGEKGPMPTSFVFPSMCDPFDNHPDLAAPRRRFFDLIRATPHLTWLLLTKRPGNIERLFREALSEADKFMLVDPPLTSLAECWPRNAAIGCTVVTQEEADQDIPKLLAAKGTLNPAFAFVSMEPLLGPVDLERAWHGESALEAECWGDCGWCEKGYPPLHNCQRGLGDWVRTRDGLDWVITGGETDQGLRQARPSHPDWFRSIRDQCADAGVPFHFKQWGEHAPRGRVTMGGGTCTPFVAWPDGTIAHGDADEHGGDGELLIWVGKKAAGRALDGVTHDARPEPHRP